MTVFGIAAKKAFKAIEQTKSLSEAAELLESWAKLDRELYYSLTSPYLANACHEVVRVSAKSKRNMAWGKSGGANQQGGRLRGLAADLLNDFFISIKGGGGVPIRDATAGDLLYAATRYRLQGEDMLHKHCWLLRIAEGVGAGTVGNVFTNEDLIRLKDATLGGGLASPPLNTRARVPTPCPFGDGVKV